MEPFWEKAGFTSLATWGSRDSSRNSLGEILGKSLGKESCFWKGPGRSQSLQGGSNRMGMIPAGHEILTTSRQCSATPKTAFLELSNFHHCLLSSRVFYSNKWWPFVPFVDFLKDSPFCHDCHHRFFSYRDKPSTTCEIVDWAQLWSQRGRFVKPLNLEKISKIFGYDFQISHVKHFGLTGLGFQGFWTDWTWLCSEVKMIIWALVPSITLSCGLLGWAQWKESKWI